MAIALSHASLVIWLTRRSLALFVYPLSVPESGVVVLAGSNPVSVPLGIASSFCVQLDLALCTFHKGWSEVVRWQALRQTKLIVENPHDLKKIARC